ncbi:PAS domain-containing protein [Methylobacterium radiotolerans]|uniref:PAS domain-containing protein n=1 Tax=Methylobacterium radiotolerans TaxID=31998 RepID=UPI00339474FD
MILTDPNQDDDPIVFTNRAFLDLTDYGIDEVVGRNCRFLQGPATEPNHVDEIRAALRDNRDLTIEITNHRRGRHALRQRPVHRTRLRRRGPPALPLRQPDRRHRGAPQPAPSRRERGAPARDLRQCERDGHRRHGCRGQGDRLERRGGTHPGLECRRDARADHRADLHARG